MCIHACVCERVCVCMRYMCVDALRGQKSISNSLELDLEVVVSCLMVLRIELWKKQVLTSSLQPHNVTFNPILWSISLGFWFKKEKTVFTGFGFFFFFMYGVLPMYISGHHVWTWCPWRPEEDFGSPRTGVMVGCKPPHGCWESNPGRLAEQLILLTAEPYIWI